MEKKKMAFKQHWPLPVKHTATTQETQHRLLQILNTGNQRIRRKCMSMVLIICNKMCCAIGKGTELARGCTDLSFPGKLN